MLYVPVPLSCIAREQDRREDMKAILKLVLAAAVMASLASASRAQTNSVNAAVNVGNPSWATFYFGSQVVGSSDTVIVIQCVYNRGFYITNLGVYGQQQETAFTILGCVSTSSKNAAGQLVLSYTVLGPVTFEAGSQTVTLNSASWSAYEHGMHDQWSIVSGSAHISVQ